MILFASRFPLCHIPVPVNRPTEFSASRVLGLGPCAQILGLVAGDRGRYPARFVDGRRHDVEGVRKPHEEAEQSRNVGGLCDLLFRPARIAEALDLLVGHAIGGASDGAGELQEQALRRIQTRRVEVTAAKCLSNSFERFALQLQEPRVCAESIPAAVDGGDVRGDHLVLGPRQRAVGEVHARGGLDGGQEIRPEAHRLEDLGDDADRALCLGGGVKVGQLSSGFGLLDHLDPRHDWLNADELENVSVDGRAWSRSGSDEPDADDDPPIGIAKAGKKKGAPIARTPATSVNHLTQDGSCPRELRKSAIKAKPSMIPPEPKSTFRLASERTYVTG